MQDLSCAPSLRLARVLPLPPPAADACPSHIIRTLHKPCALTISSCPFLGSSTCWGAVFPLRREARATLWRQRVDFREAHRTKSVQQHNSALPPADCENCRVVVCELPEHVVAQLMRLLKGRLSLVLLLAADARRERQKSQQCRLVAKGDMLVSVTNGTAQGEEEL